MWTGFIRKPTRLTQSFMPGLFHSFSVCLQRFEPSIATVEAVTIFARQPPFPSAPKLIKHARTSLSVRRHSWCSGRQNELVHQRNGRDKSFAIRIGRRSTKR